MAWVVPGVPNIPGQWRPAAGPVSSPPSSHHLLICQILSFTTLPSTPAPSVCQIIGYLFLVSFTTVLVRNNLQNPSHIISPQNQSPTVASMSPIPIKVRKPPPPLHFHPFCGGGLPLGTPVPLKWMKLQTAHDPPPLFQENNSGWICTRAQ